MRLGTASRAKPIPSSAAQPQALVLEDAKGKTRDLGAQVSNGPVVVVFYLGSTCMACVTHLVELERAMPRFRERGAEVWAVSADSPNFSRERMRRFGDFQIPLLSDSGHVVALAYGVWKPLPGGDKDDGEALHGTFIVDRGGLGMCRKQLPCFPEICYQALRSEPNREEGSMDAYAPEIERKMKRLFDSLSEDDRRRYAAVEATKLGHGGIEYIAQLLQCDPKTIRRGLAELDEAADLDTSRVRKKGVDAKS